MRASHVIPLERLHQMSTVNRIFDMNSFKSRIRKSVFRLSWPVAPHRVVSLRTLGPDGIRDQQAAVLDYKSSKNLPIRLKEQGLHILTIETTNSISVLAAEKFNDYVEEEGLTPIKIDRVIKGTRLGEGETFSSRVYYRGVPISGVTIGLIDLDSDDGILALKTTRVNGLVHFDRPKDGSWMLHAVWSAPLEESDAADYDTVFSSLSFNIK